MTMSGPILAIIGGGFLLVMLILVMAFTERERGSHGTPSLARER